MKINQKSFTTSSVTWAGLWKRFLCAYIFMGHKFDNKLGKRSDKQCLRCNLNFLTLTPYKKGKR